MKKVWMALLCLASLHSFAQTETKELNADSLAYKIVQLPDSTGKGFPNGNKITKEIGVEGGRIIAEDGRVELIFPEGALANKTKISIQPIISPIPNANGNGYQFEPSGIKFLKPVELLLHYRKEDESLCPALFMFMAIQDDAGRWEYMDYDDWDSVNHLLKGFIYHFSAVVNGNLVSLNIESREMKVGAKQDFALQIAEPPKTVSGSDELSSLPSLAPLGKEKAEWSVNGKKGGDANVGWIVPEKVKNRAKYTAPELMNNDEFMTVGVQTYIYVPVEQVTRTARKKGKIVNLGTRRENLAYLSCKVRLYDEYRLTVKVEGHYTLDCEADIADSSNFNVKLYKNKVDISELENRLPMLKVQANCPPLKYDVAGCVGPVQYNKSLLESYEFKAYPDVITMKFTPVEVKSVNSKGKRPGEINDFPGEKFDVSVGNILRFRASRTNQSYEFGLDDASNGSPNVGGKKGGKKTGQQVPKVIGKDGYVLYVYPL